MSPDYVPPTWKIDRFNCPRCGAFAHHWWEDAQHHVAGGWSDYNPPLTTSTCVSCAGIAIWVQAQMVYPTVFIAPLPHDDLAEPARATFIEARGVFSASPRASAALLRLCLQQLVAMLGAQSDNLNAAVGKLVEMGLSPKVGQAMDALRVIGNESVHPGQIDVDDDPQLALNLFDLVNIVVQSMVTDPQMITEIYGRLSQGQRDQIERRDGA
jgi:hypothetical protein